MKTLLKEDPPDPCPGSSWGRLPRLIPFPHIGAQSARAEEISLKRLGGNSLRNQGGCVPAWGAGGRDPRALIEAIGRNPRALTQGGCGQPPPPVLFLWLRDVADTRRGSGELLLHPFLPRVHRADGDGPTTPEIAHGCLLLRGGGWGWGALSSAAPSL